MKFTRLMSQLQIFQSLFESSNVRGKKSTAMQPLIWLMSILLGSLITCISLGSENYIIVFIMLIVVVVLGVFLYSYLHCLRSNPDSLRSESFVIKKMALEKGIIGDSESLAGLLVEENISKLGGDEKDERK